MLPDNKTNTAPHETETVKKTGLKGFEPLTCGLRVRRYAELSYRPSQLDLVKWSIMLNKGFGYLPKNSLIRLNSTSSVTCLNQPRLSSRNR